MYLSYKGVTPNHGLCIDEEADHILGQRCTMGCGMNSPVFVISREGSMLRKHELTMFLCLIVYLCLFVVWIAFRCL